MTRPLDGEAARRHDLEEFGVDEPETAQPSETERERPISSNTDFLHWVFGAGEGSPDENLFTCSKPGDPTGGPFPWTALSDIEDPKLNQFFCISTLRRDDNGAIRRRKANVVAQYVLVIDDVGEKVPHQKVIEKLGVPHYVLETSPGSHHVGYLLKPEYDLEVVLGLIRSACDTFTHDIAGPNRLMRLPFGVNLKPKCAGFKTRLVEVNKELSRYSATELLRKLGGTKLPVNEKPDRPYLPPDEDPVIDRLSKVGLLRNQRESNIWEIVCPWVGDHTGGDESGTVYIAPSGFKCWHGHCAGKTFAHLREHLELSAREIDEVIREAFARAVAANPEERVEGRAGELQGWGVPADDAHAQAEGELAAEELAELQEQYPIRWIEDADGTVERPFIVEGLIHEGDLVVLAGETGSLKTLIGLHLSAAVGMGAKEWQGRAVRGGVALFVMGEGGGGAPYRLHALRLALTEVERRRVGVLSRGPDLLDAKAVEVFAKRLSLDGIEPRLVTFDTYSQLAPGADENSSRDFTRAERNLRSFIETFPRCAVVIVHHPPKAGDSDTRGSGAIEANADVVLTAKNVNPRTTVSERVVAVHVKKVREGEAGGDLYFRGEVVDLGGVSSSGAPITSVRTRAATATEVEAAKRGPGGEFAVKGMPGPGSTGGRIVELLRVEAELMGAEIPPDVHQILDQAVGGLTKQQIDERLVEQESVGWMGERGSSEWDKERDKLGERSKKAIQRMSKDRIIGKYDELLYLTKKGRGLES